MHNTPEQNEAFRRAWDATNARYVAFCKSLEKQQANEKQSQQPQTPKG
jgi:hypothetical protein